MYVSNKQFLVTIKTEGTIKLNKTDIIKSNNHEIKITDFNFYLGHTQAPTSCEREYSSDTTHPFMCGEWIVAHNGVITNCEKIKRKINDKTLYNNVDTSLIPSLIYTSSKQTDDEIEAITDALSFIEGTFGVWIHNKATNNTYIARCGSTLYGNYLNNDFSSVQTRGMQELGEGILYILTPEGITEVGDFDTKSPFLII